MVLNANLHTLGKERCEFLIISIDIFVQPSNVVGSVRSTGTSTNSLIVMMAINLAEVLKR